MNYKTTLALTLALLLPIVAGAQPSTSTFELRPVIVPSTVIDGQTLNSCTDIGTAAINDAGEIAFTAFCDGGARIFTSHRMVVKGDDKIDGKFIALLPTDSPVAINNRGQVAFLAWYSDAKEYAQVDDPSGLGIFVDDRLVLTLSPGIAPTSLSLTDDGKVSFGEGAMPSQPAVSSAPAPTNPKSPGLLSHFHIKLPKGLPIGIPAPGQKPQQGQQTQSNTAYGKRLASPSTSLSMLSANAHGQLVIPVNFGERGFVLLLATPTSAIRPARVNP
jgi:hypothetical protein